MKKGIHYPKFEETWTPKQVYYRYFDPDPELTKEVAGKLWNDKKYTKENLRNVALLLLKWFEEKER